MRGLRTNRTATVIIEGHAFIQNLRRGQYQLGVEATADHLRCAAVFDELASMIRPDRHSGRASTRHPTERRNSAAGTPGGR